MRSRYEELAASYRVRIDRFDFFEQGHSLLRAHPKTASCPVCDQDVSTNERSELPAPDPRERETLISRLADLQQALQHMGAEKRPLELYAHLTQIQENGQIIIGDNTKFIPKTATISGQCNLIEFTKREGEGRYGFLLGTKDAELSDPEDSNKN
ncbi:hypothetical protein [Corynebacterium mastitidis]|uniref:hypothetical protein n=1 Tax=Corynebacterium mastitidis TaxID=161890 RepID=UPI00254FAE5F|nr:hypothetical protein [Corynebacterium mastitidis]MDK8451475.1 hypothetical protein [Corynebacterium mastitidis]